MTESPNTARAPPASESQSAFFSPRSRRQLGLFFAGAGFFAVSSVITRRALVSRHRASVPKFYQQSNRPNVQVNGPLEAVEALSIATINVFSLSMMITGGLLWSFDISSLDDMRRRIRGGLGVDDGGQSSQEAEEEMEEWLATVLARKERKDEKEDGARNEEEES